jgi:hypothetical protein
MKERGSERERERERFPTPADFEMLLAWKSF